MKDFNYDRELWAVINPDGTFAGVPCLTWEEARELANAREGRWVYAMCPDPDGEVVLEDGNFDYDPYEPFDDYLECGFDPYAGCYDFDC